MTGHGAIPARSAPPTAMTARNSPGVVATNDTASTTVPFAVLVLQPQLWVEAGEAASVVTLLRSRLVARRQYDQLMTWAGG